MASATAHPVHPAWDGVIVGGGGGGLALALLLARAGLRVAVLERSRKGSGAKARGEIIQPNGLKVLDQLGLLQALQGADVYRWRRVHFARADGAALATLDYQTLAPPYNRALVVLPEAIEQVFLASVSKIPGIEIFWDAAFVSLIWEEDRVIGVVADTPAGRRPFYASVVVGADGPRSKTRAAMGISDSLHVYANGYFTAILPRPDGFEDDLRFYLGKGVFFAAMPASEKQMYMLYQAPLKDRGRMEAEGIAAFKANLLALNPQVAEWMASPLANLVSWEQAPFTPCYRVRCARWVVHGAALMGDAAHAMNPHVAQGRNAAMADAVVLSRVLVDCFRRRDFSQDALSAYEASRRPEIDAYQRLADELTWLWESRFPPLIWARERTFRAIQQEPRLRDKILSTIAGIHLQPFNLYDRWRALHLWGALS